MRFDLYKFPHGDVEIINPPMTEHGSQVIVRGDDCYVADGNIYDKPGQEGQKVIGRRFIKVNWWKMGVDNGNADIIGG